MQLLQWKIDESDVTKTHVQRIVLQPAKRRRKAKGKSKNEMEVGQWFIWWWFFGDDGSHSDYLYHYDQYINYGTSALTNKRHSAAHGTSSPHKLQHQIDDMLSSITEYVDKDIARMQEKIETKYKLMHDRKEIHEMLKE